ncbi:hypothetical protein QDY69_10550 [Kingella negevensis]|uniref:hypothetical protein n=1 Tax=Kingella negevensis TaxID=1522312 RepID=UPI002549F20B|nr:hypothetical protein [Kingella negevensis]MDK4683348.1 hypothetical protein [Kingella negevensis]
MYWIALVTATLAQRLGYELSYSIEHKIKDLQQHLPHAPFAALQNLQNCEVSPAPLLAVLTDCLPFNFK